MTRIATLLCLALVAAGCTKASEDNTASTEQGETLADPPSTPKTPGEITQRFDTPAIKKMRTKKLERLMEKRRWDKEAEKLDVQIATGSCDRSRQDIVKVLGGGLASIHQCIVATAPVGDSQVALQFELRPNGSATKVTAIGERNRTDKARDACLKAALSSLEFSEAGASCEVRVPIAVSNLQ